MNSIKIIENNSEIAAGTRGSSLGNGALKVASYQMKNDFFIRNESTVIQDHNYLLAQPTNFKHALRIDGIHKVYKNVSESVNEAIKDEYIPIVLAGDHGSAGGSIAGVKKAHPNKRLGVIWIDAHGDLHTPYTTPSGNVHGMPLATALNSDNLDAQINEPDKATLEHWDGMKNMGGIAPKILPEDLVFIGLRDTEKPEDEYIAKNNIPNHSIDELRSEGVDVLVKNIQEKLSDCDIIYVSFDVDSMDPKEISHGTGTPVDDGLHPEEARALMEKICSDEKVVCVEMVEVNPCLDEKGNKMAETAFSILDSFSKVIENRN